MTNRSFPWRNFIVTICLSFILISLTYVFPTSNQPLLAQSDLNLQSDIISLQARISRLEQEVSSLRSSNSRSLELTPPKPNQPPTPPKDRTIIGNPPAVDGQVVGRSDPLYARLATLLVELKEEVRSLDRRLTKIEQTTP